MNFVKLFEESDLLNLLQCSTDEAVRAIISKKGVDTNTITTLIMQLCQLATINNFNIQQKQKALNLLLTLLQSISTTQTKEAFIRNLEKAIEHISLRDQLHKLSFTPGQIAQIKEFFLQKILPYYELYEIVLDNHPHFNIEGSVLKLVRILNENPLTAGTSVEVQGIPSLKQFLGVRAPKQEKKDAKKK